ncbi:MAG: RNA methyltransferase [Cyanobacteria bacterium]|nr:RNA methyltransferase [Cyanobacteriota bacterium]
MADPQVPSPAEALALDRIRIVLVEPAGPLNIGAIARAMKNFGLSRLVLVNPQCDPVGGQARQMAVHAGDLLAQAQRVATLTDALSGCQHIVATVGRDVSTDELAIAPPAIAMAQIWQKATTGQTVALIFGREDRGLLNPEIALAHQLIRIPTSDAYGSMNLAQAATVCFYELFSRAIAPPPSLVTTPNEPTSDGSTAAMADELAPPPPFEATESFYGDLEDLLLAIGYLYPHTAASRMQTFRKLLTRAQPSDRDLAMLRGILRQTRWAIAHGPTSNPNSNAGTSE